jgi:hypothetical protein
MRMTTREVCTLIYRVWAGFFFLFVLHGTARPQPPPGQSNPKPDSYTIKVDVNMVVLHATVETHKGVLVSGLSQSDFQVYEDGAAQEIK